MSLIKASMEGVIDRSEQAARFLSFLVFFLPFFLACPTDDICEWKLLLLNIYKLSLVINVNIIDKYRWRS